MDVFRSAVADAPDKPPKLGRQPTAVSAAQDFPVRTLAAGEHLFQEGDPKTHLHKITAGFVCEYRALTGPAEEIIEFAFPGDVLGLGYLHHQIHCARALVRTQVKCLPLGSLENVIKYDLRAKHRYADALSREFAYRRELLTTANRHNAIGRVAAFLLAVSQFNTDEGRGTDIVTDTLSCGVVADWLKLDIGSLQCALVELEKRQLIEPCTAQGLRLVDLKGLEALAGRNAHRMPAA